MFGESLPRKPHWPHRRAGLKLVSAPRCDPCACPRCLLRFAASERRLALLEGGRALPPLERDALAEILPAIVGVLGSEIFAVRELFGTDVPALRLGLRGRSSRAIGRLLARAAGQDVNGYVAERVSTERHAILWRVGVSNSQ